MIQVEHLSKIYNGGGSVVKALDDVSFTLPPVGLIFILGKSGCGKTTLLNVLGGMDSPTEGDIIVNGRSLHSKREKDLDSYRNNSVGFVFQEFDLLENYTVGSNVSLALQLQNAKATRQQVEDVLRRVELVGSDGETLYDRKISQLSGGQKQRVAIARALIKEPEIILADEPTGALDSETSASLFALLKELSQNKLIVVVSHDRENAERYGDRIIELKDGKIVSDKKTAEDKAAPVHPVKTERKGHLPFARVLTMGLAGFRKKTVRLVLSVLLAVFSLTIFVFSVSALNADVILSELKTSYDNGAQTVTLTAYVQYTEIVEYPSGRSFDREDEHDYMFSQEQLAALREQTNIYPILEMPRQTTADEYLDKGDLTNSQRLNPYIYFSADFIPRYVVVDENTEPEDLGFSAITENSRLPQTAGEIAITDYHADLFMRFGYREGQEGAVQQIDSAEDLIGKTIYGRTIVGVYSTEESLAWLKQYDKDFDGVYLSNYSDDAYVDVDGYFFDWSRGDHMIKTALIGSEGLELTEISQVLYRLTGNAGNDKKLIESIFYRDETVEKSGTMTYYFDRNNTVYVSSAYSGFTAAAWMFTDEMFLTPALIIGIVVAIFSALLLMNFLLVTTEARKREIGILRALGASKMDTINICLAESAVIGIADFVLSLIAGSVVCLVINRMFRFYLFSIGILPAVYLFLLCFGTVALATVLPALKISRQKPVDILREN